MAKFILKRHLSFYFDSHSLIYQKIVGANVKYKLFSKGCCVILLWKNTQKERTYASHGPCKPPWVCHNILSLLFNVKIPFYQYLTQIFKSQSWCRVSLATYADCSCMCMHAQLLQSRPTLCNPVARNAAYESFFQVGDTSNAFRCLASSSSHANWGKAAKKFNYNKVRWFWHLLLCSQQ